MNWEGEFCLNIVLDTSIIASDFFMKSSKFRILFKYAEKVPYDIYLPEVVYDEVLNKYQEMFQKQMEIYEKALAQFNPLLQGKNYDFLGFDIDIEIENYEYFLKDQIKKNRLKLLSYPKTSHREIVRHELSRKKPFKSNGSGYRDKLILDTILENFYLSKEITVFVSNNSNDFGQEPSFHQDLFFGKKVPSANRYIIKNTLSSFINDYIHPIQQVDNHVKTISQLSNRVGLNISDWLLANLKSIINSNGIAYAIMGLDEGFGSVLLSKVDYIKNVVIFDVLQIDDSTISCSIRLEANLLMSVSGNRENFVHSESWKEFFADESFDENVSLFTLKSVMTKLTISIVIDVEQISIVSFDPLEIEGRDGTIDLTW